MCLFSYVARIRPKPAVSVQDRCKNGWDTPVHDLYAFSELKGKLLGYMWDTAGGLLLLNQKPISLISHLQIANVKLLATHCEAMQRFKCQFSTYTRRIPVTAFLENAVFLYLRISIPVFVSPYRVT